MLNYTTALSIAGSDPSGGAGIQADIKTFSALGCYGMSVITALTAQNTQGVQGVHTAPAEFVELQLKSIFADIKVNATKTGMLHNAKVIDRVANFFKTHPSPLIIDPVIMAKDGSLLLETEALDALKAKLLPYAYLITPNLPEAELLLEYPIQNEAAMEQAARDLTDLGAHAVLIKGGHLNDSESNDCLYIRKEQKLHWFNAKRINTRNTHGTGCTLSAAITALIAQNVPLYDAVAQAKAYLNAALIKGADYQLGLGYGPVHHFHSLWKKL